MDFSYCRTYLYSGIYCDFLFCCGISISIGEMRCIRGDSEKDVLHNEFCECEDSLASRRGYLVWRLVKYASSLIRQNRQTLFFLPCCLKLHSLLNYGGDNVWDGRREKEDFVLESPFKRIKKHTQQSYLAYWWWIGSNFHVRTINRQ